MVSANEQLINNFIQARLIADKSHGRPGNTDNLIESGAIDSLGILKLVNYLEETFAIKIVDMDLIAENFETIQAISLFVESKRQAGHASHIG